MLKYLKLFEDFWHHGPTTEKKWGTIHVDDVPIELEELHTNTGDGIIKDLRVKDNSVKSLNKLGITREGKPVEAPLVVVPMAHLHNNKKIKPGQKMNVGEFIELVNDHASEKLTKK